MDEYNINNIEKINSINFININNEKASPEISNPIFNRINYLNSLNKMNSYSTKKTKKMINNNKNLFLNENIIEHKMKNNNYNQRYNNDEILDDLYEMNRTNISDIKINSKMYQGFQKNSNIISHNNLTNNNTIKKNFVKPIEKIKMNNTNNNYNKILFKKFNSNNHVSNNTNNQMMNMNKPINKVYNNKTINNHKNNNNNQHYQNINSFTDYSMDETNSINNKIILYIKKINEYKKTNKQLVEKLNILTNNLKLKSNEIQNLQQKNQALQNELYLIKVNNEQGKNSMKINNNEELKKILMQKNKIINDVSQKMKMMKQEMEDKIAKNSNLSQILTKKNMELVRHQKELIEKDKKIEELNLELNNQKLNINKKNEELNIINSELKNENDEKEKKIENLSKKINNLEIDLKGVKNNEKEYFFKNKKNQEIIEQKDKQIQQLNEQISQLNNNKQEDLTNKDNQNKESEILLRKIEDLTNENNKLSKYINMINPQNLIISPNNYTIIANKYHKKLIWYLLYKKSTPIDSKKDSNDYNNYIWVKGTDIKKEDLKNYNKFEDEKKKLTELTECIIEKQKKLEMKEEKINELDYKNQKLSSQLHNKTANIKGNNNNIFSGKQIRDNSNFANSFNTEAAENEKYKNLLEKLNDSNKRNLHLHNQVAILKEKLNEKDNLEKKFPHDMKDIDPHLIDSGFLDDDSMENKEIEINDLFNKEEKNDIENNININNEQNINNNNNKITIENTNTNNKSNSDELNKAINLNNSKKDDPFKESERKVDEFLANGAGDEDDFDEVKVINKQMNFLKEEIKDYREKSKNLGNEIKELFSKIKCNDKNRKHIVQICQILNFQPAIIDQIISNKFKIDKDKSNNK